MPESAYMNIYDLLCQLVVFFELRRVYFPGDKGWFAAFLSLSASKSCYLCQKNH